MSNNEFENKMTIFYSKETGKIKMAVSSLQDMNIFGEDKSDYNYDFIQLDRDDYILENINKFIVENNTIILKSDLRDSLKNIFKKKVI